MHWTKAQNRLFLTNKNETAVTGFEPLTSGSMYGKSALHLLQLDIFSLGPVTFIVTPIAVSKIVFMINGKMLVMCTLIQARCYVKWKLSISAENKVETVTRG